MPDLSQRSAATELMDDLSCSGEIIGRTLYELDVINKWLGGNRVTTRGVTRLLKKKKPAGPVSIADLGCGSGDMLRRISLQMGKDHSLALTGIDANPHIIAYARTHSADLANVDFTAMNIFSEEFKKQHFDIVIATLFFHHFTTSQLIGIFRQLKVQARTGIVINDLHRHWFAFHSIRLLTKYFSGSDMVKHDAPVSVLRAFRKKELKNILAEAGIDNYILRWRWAFRWQLIIEI